MAKIIMPDSFLAVTQGEHEIQVQVENYRELVTELTRKWPDLADLLSNTAVAIDGEIFQDPFLEPIGDQSEVYFMARIEGG